MGKQTIPLTTVHELIHINIDKRVIRYEYQGDIYWIKRPESVKLNLWHKLGEYISKWIDSPLLVPTVAVDGESSLKGECERLIKFYNAGIHVPKVIACSGQYLVTLDAGNPISSIMRDSKRLFSEKRLIVLKVSYQLAMIHKKGLWHGRPSLRDIVYDGENVALLDFEEDPSKVLSPLNCMVRDSLIYVHSLHYYLRDYPELIHEAIVAYQEETRKDVWLESIRIANSFWPIYWLLKWLYPIAGKDARFAYHTLDVFRSS